MARSTKQSRTDALETLDQITEHAGDCQHTMTVSITEDPYRYQCETCGTKLVSLWAADASEPVATEAPTPKRARKPRRPVSIETAQEPVEAQVEPEAQTDADEMTALAQSAHILQEGVPAPTDRVIEAVIADDGAAYRAELATHEDDPRWPVATRTSAPKDYDGFGTQTVETDCGLYCGKTIRKVETPLEHLTWQRQRYASGLNTVAGATEWQEIQASAAFLRENVLRDAPATLVVDDPPPVEPSPGMESEAPHHPNAQVEYVLTLASEGPDAVARALARGTVKVRLPRQARTPKPGRSGDTTRGVERIGTITVKQFALLVQRTTQGQFPGNLAAQRTALYKRGLIVDTSRAAALTEAGQVLVAAHAV